VVPGVQTRGLGRLIGAKVAGASVPDWPGAFHSGDCGKLVCRRSAAEMHHACQGPAPDHRR
jgi:hypothetical protein